MKHGTATTLGGGAHLIAFTVTTDGSGDPTSTFYGPNPSGAITVARTGVGIYTFTPDLRTYGADKLGFWSASVNLGSGDWTSRGSVNRTTGVLTVSLFNGGAATNVVSGQIAIFLVFGPQGY